MYSNVVCKRRGVSGTGFGLSFARFGSAIWTNVQTSNQSSYHLRPICCVYITVCGGKGSLLGSRVRPTAVKPMLWPKVQEERVGEAEP